MNNSRQRKEKWPHLVDDWRKNVELQLCLEARARAEPKRPDNECRRKTLFVVQRRARDSLVRLQRLCDPRRHTQCVAIADLGDTRNKLSSGVLHGIERLLELHNIAPHTRLHGIRDQRVAAVKRTPAN